MLSAIGAKLHPNPHETSASLIGWQGIDGGNGPPLDIMPLDPRDIKNDPNEFYRSVMDVGMPGVYGNFYLGQGAWREAVMMANGCIRPQGLDYLDVTSNSTDIIDRACFSLIGDILFAGISSPDMPYLEGEGIRNLLHSNRLALGDWVGGAAFWAWGAERGDASSQFALATLLDRFPRLSRIFLVRNGVMDISLLSMLRDIEASPYEIDAMVLNDHEDEGRAPVLALLTAARINRHSGATVALAMRTMRGLGTTPNCRTGLELLNTVAKEPLLAADRDWDPGLTFWSLCGDRLTSKLLSLEEISGVVENYHRSPWSPGAALDFGYALLTGRDGFIKMPLAGQEVLEELLTVFSEFPTTSLATEEKAALGMAMVYLGLLELNGTVSEPILHKVEWYFIQAEDLGAPLAPFGLALLHRATNERLCDKIFEVGQGEPRSCTDFYLRELSSQVSDAVAMEGIIAIEQGDLEMGTQHITRSIELGSDLGAYSMLQLVSRELVAPRSCEDSGILAHSLARNQGWFTSWRSRVHYQMLRSEWMIARVGVDIDWVEPMQRFIFDFPQPPSEDRLTFERRWVAMWATRLATATDDDAAVNLAVWNRQLIDPLPLRTTYETAIMPDSHQIRDVIEGRRDSSARCHIFANAGGAAERRLSWAAARSGGSVSGFAFGMRCLMPEEAVGMWSLDPYTRGGTLDVVLSQALSTAQFYLRRSIRLTAFHYYVLAEIAATQMVEVPMKRQTGWQLQDLIPEVEVFVGHRTPAHWSHPVALVNGLGGHNVSQGSKTSKWMRSAMGRGPGLEEVTWQRQLRSRSLFKMARDIRSSDRPGPISALCSYQLSLMSYQGIGGPVDHAMGRIHMKNMAVFDAGMVGVRRLLFSIVNSYAMAAACWAMVRDGLLRIAPWNDEQDEVDVAVIVVKLAFLISIILLQIYRSRKT